MPTAATRRMLLSLVLVLVCLASAASTAFSKGIDPPGRDATMPAAPTAPSVESGPPATLEPSPLSEESAAEHSADHEGIVLPLTRPDVATTSALLTVVASPALVGVGETLTATVHASSLSAGLSGFQVDVSYDPAVLTPTASAPGSLLGATGRAVVCPPATHPSDGSVRFACANY